MSQFTTSFSCSIRRIDVCVESYYYLYEPTQPQLLPLCCCQYCRSIIGLNLFAVRLKCFVYLQKIAEQKLQAFAIGAMGQRPLSRREQEERRKKEEEEAAASVCCPHHFAVIS